MKDWSICRNADLELLKSPLKRKDEIAEKL